MAGAEDAVYVYGVAAAGDADALPRGNGGIDPLGQLDLVREGRLVAVCSNVGMTLLAPDGDDTEAELTWLERTARAHDAVLTRALAAEAVVPFRLGVVVADRRRLRELLRDHAATFEEHLERLRGAHEWGLKGFVDPDRAPAGDEQATELEREAAAGGGAAFFARKLLARRREEAVREWASALAAELHDRAAALARQAVVSAPQPQAAQAYADELILNGAYLVERGREPELAATVEELRASHAGQGVRVELTGPWPPYSFVDSTLAAG